LENLLVQKWKSETNRQIKSQTTIVCVLFIKEYSRKVSAILVFFCLVILSIHSFFSFLLQMLARPLQSLARRMPLANVAKAIASTPMVHIPQHQQKRQLSGRVVTIEEAKKMPRLYREMPNDILLTMAVMGDQDAREERVIREIMAVDNVTW
jgi:hypothetical protein